MTLALAILSAIITLLVPGALWFGRRQGSRRTIAALDAMQKVHEAEEKAIMEATRAREAANARADTEATMPLHDWLNKTREGGK